VARAIDLDLTVSRTDELHGIAAPLLIVLEAPDAFTIRVDDPSSDELPGRDRLHIEAPVGETIQKVYVTNAVGVGIAQLLVVD